MVTQLKNLTKKILPEWLWKMPKQLAIKVKFKRMQLNHGKALKKVRGKDQIKVAFFLIHESVWKYESVYRLMEKDGRFNPIVIVCPYIIYTEEVMFREMNHAYDSFKKKGYQVVKSFDEQIGDWLNVKKDIKPDIVCFTNPWKLTRSEYLVENYRDTLSCYVPYGFKNSYLYQSHFNHSMQNSVWKFFLETDIHQKLSRQYSNIKGANTIVTGFPGLDQFLQKDYRPLNVWKIKDIKVKRVIWAPHHTIQGMGATLDYSTFLKYADSMLEIANSFQENVQFAFKPHPILRAKLSTEEVWGKEKTDQYYQKWAELPNGQLHEGEYIDLFLSSDGLIHDCSSFVIEYLYTKKPVMFLINDDSVYEKFNEIGKMALSNLYHGKNLENINHFIKEVILQGDDFMRKDRILFFKSIIKPPHNVTASENIFNDLKEAIFSDKV